MLAQNLGLLFSLGCAKAVSYRYALEPKDAGRLLTAWLTILVPLGVVAFLVGQLALPVLFDAQSDDAVTTARLFLLTVVLVLWGELVSGMLLGAGEYLLANAMRAAMPALAAATHLTLWITDALTVETALLASAAASVLVQAVGMRRVLRLTKGDRSLSRDLVKETAWYGFRGQGGVLAGALNQRLDLLIMPAFLASASIGLYSIAANVSLIVYGIASSFGALLLPATVRRGPRGPATIVRSLQTAGVLAIAVAVGLFIVARPALELVYGEEFSGSAPPLRLLLPGTAMFALASILIAGLYAANRPTIATLSQASGLVVTVVGLLVFLPGNGIEAAAIVSTAAYASVFLTALFAYKRVVGLSWRGFVSRPAALPAT
jgi:O-antigen/teichoic acid export membrane protein